MTTKQLLILCLLLTISIVQSGSFASESQQQIRFTHINYEQGLGQPTILSIIKDHQGFMWFGTQDGLHRFDGYEFKVYRTSSKNPNTISGGMIWSLEQDSNDIIWSGTDSGLNKFNPKTETFTRIDYHPPGQSNTVPITSILEDGNSQLWLGSQGGGLTVFNREASSFQSFLHHPDKPSTISSNEINIIYEDSKGRLWIGTGFHPYRSSNKGGLNLLSQDKSQFTRFHRGGADIRNDSILSIEESSDGKLWLGYADGSLILFDPETGQMQEQSLKLSLNDNIKIEAITDLYLEANQSLWVATSNTGVYRLNLTTDKIQAYVHDPVDNNSINDNFIYQIYADNNVIWFGSWASGLNKINKTKSAFSTISFHPQLDNALIGRYAYRVMKDTKKRLWVSSLRDGITIIDEDNQYTKLAPDNIVPGVKDVYVRAFYEDLDGTIYLGTLNSGLLRYIDSSLTFEQIPIETADGQQVDLINQILRDSDNTLWLGTDRFGLISLNEDFTIKRQYAPGGNTAISSAAITQIFEDSRNNIWIGTDQDGLDLFNRTNHTFEHFNSNGQDTGAISSDLITYIMEDSNGNIWIGTSSGGINRLQFSKGQWSFSSITIEEGLSANAIGGILEDDLGNLWISTTQGIDKYSPTNNTVANFTPEDGTLVNGYFIDSVFKDEAGVMYFGGLNGFNHFIPTEVSAGMPPPSPMITELRLFNQPLQPPYDSLSPLTKSISDTTGLTLTHQQNVFSLGFSTLEYISPIRQKYAYKLKGFDNDWIYTGAEQRIATYTNLDPGNYTFEVISANKDGIWNENSRKLSIKILPAPWATWWAYGLYLSIIGAIGYAFARQRYLRQVAVEESEKRLKLSLWGSGDELWDWHAKDNLIVRLNELDYIERPDKHKFDYATLRNYIHPDDYLILKNELDDLMYNKSEYFEASYRIKGKHTDWIWILDRGKVVTRDNKGNPIRCTGTMKDISRLKQAESSLRELNLELEQRVEQRTEQLAGTNEQLNEAMDSLESTLEELQGTQEQLVKTEKMAALGKIVAGVAHEINTPIGICITAISHLMERGDQLKQKLDNKTLKKSDFEEFHKEYGMSCNLIKKNLERSSTIIGQFKDISSDTTGEPDREFNVKEYIERVASIYEQQCIDANIIVKIESSSEIVIHNYPGTFYQVLNALIGNALLHGFADRNDGQISIVVKDLKSQIEISVVDTGKGMNELTQSRIFDPFFTTSRMEGRSGLGLTTVYNQVTQILRGDIQCVSILDEGTTFKLTLPKSIERAENAFDFI